MKYHQEIGVTLIELIIFIIILGICGSGILISFVVALSKSPDIEKMTLATVLAQERVEFLLGRRILVGFESFVDLCDGSTSQPIFCTLPTGYVINQVLHPTITSNWNGNADYKLINVVVSGTGDATLKEVVTNY
jgi:hypothetical protein